MHRMTISRMGLASLVTLVLLVGCELLPFGPAPALDGREFLSTSVAVDGTDRPLVAGTRLRLGFQDGAISASAGCNLFGGDYRVDGGVLRITGASMTEMACQPPLDEQEAWFFAFLGAEPFVVLTGDVLILEEDNTVITMLDREVAEPDLPLAGPVWTVTGIISGDAVTTAPQEAVATLTFTPERLVMVDTGCNTGSGGYDLVGNTIRFGAIAMTRMACEEPISSLEQAVVTVLNADVVRYEIEASTMTLSTGDRGLQLTGTN